MGVAVGSMQCGSDATNTLRRVCRRFSAAARRGAESLKAATTALIVEIEALKASTQLYTAIEPDGEHDQANHAIDKLSDGYMQLQQAIHTASPDAAVQKVINRKMWSEKGRALSYAKNGLPKKFLKPTGFGSHIGRWGWREARAEW